MSWLACLIPAPVWQVAVYLLALVPFVEQTRLLVVPVLFTAICWLGLKLRDRWPEHRVAIMRATLAVLTVGWLVLKFTVLRGHASAALGLQGGIVLPAVVGVSYLYIKLAHVCVDAMRPKAPQIRPLTLLALAAFPPTYEAGPMHRYEEFAASFEHQPPLAQRDWWEVFRRLVWGLFKLTVVGAMLSQRCLPTFQAATTASPLDLWQAMYCYSFYIYFNFSGMTDLAIGAGKAFGIEVPENFANPYLRRDIQQFWQNWHITLTRWLQAYLFMPISRRLMKTSLRRRPQVVAWIGYLVTFTFCGLWHGEGAHFVAWGAYHAVGLGLYASVPARWKPDTSEPNARLTPRGLLWWFLTFNFVSFGWLLFVCPLRTAVTILQRMVGLG